VRIEERPMIRLSSLAWLGAGMGLAGISHGCTALLDIPEDVTAYLWCLDAKPAKGMREDNLTLIQINEPSGAWTRGCKCYCPADHAIMVDGANGALAPGSEDEVWYGVQVGLLRGSATSACNDRVAELEAIHGTLITFDDPATVSCLDAVADEDPYYASQCVLDDETCPPGAGGGFGTDGYVPGTDGTTADEGTTTDGGADSSGTSSATAEGDSSTGGGAIVYGLDDWSAVVDCPTGDRCDVEAGFVAELLADLDVFSDDHIAVRPGVSRLGHHGFVLAELGPDSFPAALGLQPGDVLWRVGGVELRTFGDVGRAFEVLNQATVLTAEIDRGAVTVQRSYRIVERVGDR
jgi:hypothetical protein